MYTPINTTHELLIRNTIIKLEYIESLILYYIMAIFILALLMLYSVFIIVYYTQKINTINDKIEYNILEFNTILLNREIHIIESENEDVQNPSNIQEESKED